MSNMTQEGLLLTFILHIEKKETEKNNILLSLQSAYEFHLQRRLQKAERMNELRPPSTSVLRKVDG